MRSSTRGLFWRCDKSFVDPINGDPLSKLSRGVQAEMPSASATDALGKSEMRLDEDILIMAFCSFFDVDSGLCLGALG
jgi:hypothetical protein